MKKILYIFVLLFISFSLGCSEVKQETKENQKWNNLTSLEEQIIVNKATERAL